MKAASASKKKGVLKKTRNSRTIWNYHIMVLIGMVWLFFFNIVPMFGIVIAFEDTIRCPACGIRILWEWKILPICFP